MKKFLAMVMTVAMVISMMTVVSFAAATMTPIITASDVVLGEEVVVTLSIPAYDYGAARGAVNLAYDSTKLELLELSGGAMVTDVLGVEPKIQDDGTIYVNWATTVNSTIAEVAKGGDIFVMKFRAIAEGDATFSLVQMSLNGKLPKPAIPVDTSYTKTIKVKSPAPAYEDGFYNLTTADNKASVKYFGTVGAATLYVATYNEVGTGLELVSVKTADITAGTVDELTTVTTEAAAAGDVVRAFLWDANMNAVTVGTLAE